MFYLQCVSIASVVYWVIFWFCLFYVACILVLLLLLIAEFGFSYCLSFFDCV